MSLQRRKRGVEFDLDKHGHDKHNSKRRQRNASPTNLTSSWPSPFSKLPSIGSVGQSWDAVDTKGAPLTEKQTKLLKSRFALLI